MHLSLLLLRYGFVLIPGIATIYLSHRIESESIYVLLLLFYLFLIENRDLRWERRFANFHVPPLLLLELLGLTALCFQYGGLLPLSYFSVLLTLHNRSNLFIVLAACIGIVMNVMSFNYDVSFLLVTNVCFFAFAVLLYQLQRTTHAKKEADVLYDALKVKHYELEEARKTVIEYAAKVQEAAQVEERNRIAHDLHDDLGHKLIRLKMMLEASIRLSETAPDKALEMVREVRDQIADGMESLRTTVRRLKPVRAASARYSLEGLIEQIAQANDIKVEYLLTGIPYPLYPSDEFILFRNAQEAITNAIRHGQATEVSIVVDYSPSALCMTVHNNGAVLDEMDIKKGLGWMGMEERLRVVGGHLSFARKPCFSITTTLPRREAPHV